MSEALNWAGIATALLLPWACGMTWVAWLLRRAGYNSLLLPAGYGFFIGMLTTTVILRAWDGLTDAVSFGGVAAILVVLTLIATGCLRKTTTAAPSLSTRPTGSKSSTIWHKVVIALVLLWIGVRYGTMAQELLLRPLYAWDAWMNWAPKAITWFHEGTLVPWVSPPQWYPEATGQAYSLGNRMASGYPQGVPLIQLWFMLGAETWDHGAVYIAWLAVPVALGMALYGHLRLAQVPVLAAVLVVYLLLNMPFFNVHTVLAGYADSWQAAVFGLGVLALREWRVSRQATWLMLWVTMAVLCSLLKNPGIILGFILIIAGVREAIKLPLRLELGLVAVVALVISVLVFSAATLPVPLLGDVGWNDGRLALGRIGSFEIQYHAVGASFAESFFQSTNWNLWFYLATPLVLWLLWQNRSDSLNPPAEVLALIAACGFVLFSFFFTNRFGGALNFSTVNRALLYLVPPMLFCLTVATARATGQPRKQQNSET